MGKMGFLERLDNGPVLCDGGFVFALEKRGYVEAGPWTPEAVIEHPDAVLQLHKEFIRAGSDVNQAFTFYASEDKINNRGHAAGKLGCGNINREACKLVRKATEGRENCLVAGGVCQTPTYISNGDKEAVKNEFKKQLVVFKEQEVDLMICEYFEHVEEAEWAVEAVKEFMPGMPVCVSLCINDESDVHGISTGECGVRLAKCGADVVGINCHFDPFRCLAAVKKMIAAVQEAGLKVHYMIQPLGFWTPDASVQGFIDLPEFPFALEPRIMTRFDMARYARESYDAGIRFIGGCCGFEPYHIRAVAEELQEERGGEQPEGCQKHQPWGACLSKHTKPWVRSRASRQYWETLNPSTGRPYSASLSKPAAWGMTRGDDLLVQHESATTTDEIEKLKELRIEKVLAAN